MFINYLFKNTNGFLLKENPDDKWDGLFLMLLEFLDGNPEDIEIIKITKKDGRVNTYEKKKSTIKDYLNYLKEEMWYDNIKGFVEKDNFKSAEIYYLNKKAIVSGEGNDWKVEISEEI